MSRLLDELARDPVLEARLAQHYPGTIYAFSRVPSTMDVAHQVAADGATEGTLIFAARQEQGRGRLGRRWESPAGGAYCSLILRPTRPPAEIPQLSLVAGLGVAEAIRQVADLSPTIRWPNDVLVEGRKLAGILIEASVQRLADSVQNYVVIGVGINVSTHARELPESATSLLEALRSSSTLNAVRYPLDPVALTGRLCRRIRAWYDVWSAQGFSPIRDAVRPFISLFGQMVRMTTNQRGADSVQRIETTTIEGQAIDIDEAGRLVVRLDSGLLRAFTMGEVTLLR